MVGAFEGYKKIRKEAKLEKGERDAGARTVGEREAT